MKKSIGLAGAFLSITLLGGCATMFSGKTQEISFNSRPEGAEVMVGSQSCITPCKMQISKDKAYREIVAMKKGYQKEKITIQHNRKAVIPEVVIGNPDFKIMDPR